MYARVHVYVHVRACAGEEMSVTLDNGRAAGGWLCLLHVRCLCLRCGGAVRYGAYTRRRGEEEFVHGGGDGQVERLGARPSAGEEGGFGAREKRQSESAIFGLNGRRLRLVGVEMAGLVFWMGPPRLVGMVAWGPGCVW